MDPAEAPQAPQTHTEVPTEAPAADGLSLPVVAGGGGVLLALLLAFFVLRGGRSAPVELPDTTEAPAEGPTAAVDSDLSPQVEAPDVEVPPRDDVGLVGRLRGALSRSREALQGRFDHLFRRTVIDEELFEELEMILLVADVGLSTTERLIAPLRTLAEGGEQDPQVLREALNREIRTLLARIEPALRPAPAEGPHVLLVVGVNGSGKTTTIGKLAARFRDEGKKVLLAAGDTFRAAAGEQLAVWAERADADIVMHQEGADPGAVAYDALQAALARGHDVVLVDTAGRLQTRRPLMEQLTKIRRVIDKVVPGAPHETLLVLDGTMGQNGLSQAKLFDEATPLSGVVVTKLDGTAKGGMILTLTAELNLPIKFIGIGEQVEDLRPFDPDAFVEALT